MSFDENEAPRKLLLAGGGTGGHIFIGLALAQEWKRRVKDADILFLGARGRLEERLVPNAGIRMELLDVAQLKGVSVLRKAMHVAALPAVVFRCMRIVRRFRPHAAIGVGGYSSGPAILAAGLLGVPSMIVEPNAMPGLTNRWLRPFIRLAAVSFSDAASHFGQKARFTGVPVRSEFFRADKRPAERSGLLVFGGSQGSGAINAVAAEAIPRLKAAVPELRVMHQTGAAEYERYRGLQNAWWQIVPFIEDMAAAMHSSSVVVCRAGAGTIAELAATGRCAVLVPFPFASDDHQTRNARALASQGAAGLLLQSHLTPDSLTGAVLDLLRDPGRRSAMEGAIRGWSHPRSAETIIDLALGMAPAGARSVD